MAQYIKQKFARLFPTFSKSAPQSPYGTGVVLKKPAFLHFGIQDQVLFAKRISMILRSGMPLVRGLDMLGSQSSSKSGAYIMKTLAAHVETGMPLSSGLEKFKKIFGGFCISIIHVGETSGTLHENFNYLAEELKKKNTLRKKVVGALIYPAIIILATVGISLVLTIYIFPKITPIFKSFKTALPLSTRILMGLSNFLIHNGIWLVVGVACFLVLAFFLAQINAVRRYFDELLIRLPVLGKLCRYYNLANTSRTLSLLMKSDVNLLQSFTIVASSTQNLAYRAVLEKVTEEVTKGQRISSELQKYPLFFPGMATQMLVVGEQTGNLSGSLMYLSDMYEEEIDDLTKNLTTMIEPILMVVMGCIVGFIAVSIITPIYGITQTLTNYR